MDYTVKLQAFEGPFDLLLFLIEKNEVDIWDIPIAEITAQYLAYIRAMQELDLELASEFLVVAAKLLAIKSRMLLPTPPAEADEEPEDARAELVHDLLEYKRFKEAASMLGELEHQRALLCGRPDEEAHYLSLFTPPDPLQGVQLPDLGRALQNVLQRLREADMEDGLEIRRAEITVRDKMDLLTERLFSHGGSASFTELFADGRSRLDVIVQFLALLELIHMGLLRAVQDEVYEDIYLYAVDMPALAAAREKGYAI